jgi:hypothetical protein
VTLVFGIQIGPCRSVSNVSFFPESVDEEKREGAARPHLAMGLKLGVGHSMNCS